MKETIEKLEQLEGKIKTALLAVDLPGKQQKLQELEILMQESGFWQDQQKAKKISQQAAYFKMQITKWQGLQKSVADTLDLAEEDAEDLDVNLRQEINTQVIVLEKDYFDLERELLLAGKHDSQSAILSIYAGAGGDDAQDWAEMLSRMYLRYAEKQDWQTEILDASRGGQAGIKSMTIMVTGAYAYGFLKSEKGVHRLVRLSPFDSDKARHTSFALVEILPDIADVEEVQIDEKDLRVDTFMSSGKGGQSVNTTYSAVRIVHIPTGFTVSCQNERSQQQNKLNALKILKAKLQLLKEEQHAAEIKDLKGEHKDAAWGNQIRSYVLHPYKMVKDLRTSYEESDPTSVLDGNLLGFVDSYLHWQVKK
jgi:peptide chain release factor 2